MSEKHDSNLEFRKVPSLQFLYEVSEDGRFLRNVKSKKYLKIFLDFHHSKAGYYASFVNIKGKIRRVMMHALVAECWLGRKPEGCEIDHADRNSHHNHYTNLRYVTHSEQMRNRKLGQHVIEQATKNCLNYTLTVVAKPVIVTKDGKSEKFRSMMQAAFYIGNQLGINPEHVRYKLKKRRSHILGFDIAYLNAETGHAGPTGQGTAQ